MGDRTDIEDFEKKAVEYLVGCYDLSGGDDSAPLDMDEVAEELGFEPRLKTAVVDHLLEQGMIKLLGLGDAMSITARGIARARAVRS